MKFIKGKRHQNGRDREGRTKAMQSGPHNRLRLAAANKAAANKAAKVKLFKAVKRQPNNGTLNKRKMLAKNNARVAPNNVVDARVTLLQKALQKSSVIVDARQKLTKQKDAREKIQERRLHSSSYDNSYSMGTSRGHSNNLGRVKIDCRGILTVKTISDERASSHHISVRDQRPSANQGHFDGVKRQRSSNKFNSEWNSFRSYRPIEEIRPMRRDNIRISRRQISNVQSMRQPSERFTIPTRVNEKPYSKPMAMDYEDSMDLEETNRFSPVMRRSIGRNTMFNHDGYEDDSRKERDSRNHRGLNETLRSRLDSHQAAVVKSSRPAGHKIVISNLEPSVTSEDITELFTDMGNLFESGVVRPGVAEVIYERREDAIQAIDVYHNRQLDGRPMKCEMVRNAGSNHAGPISFPGSSQRMPSRATDMYKPSAYVTYDIDAIHTALFNK